MPLLLSIVAASISEDQRKSLSEQLNRRLAETDVGTEIFSDGECREIAE